MATVEKIEMEFNPSQQVHHRVLNKFEEIDDSKQRNLTTNEILEYANKSIWKIPRIALVALIFLLFCSMLIAVIVQVATNPICTKPRDIKWFQNSVIYRINAKAFYDSDGDGQGDLNGIAEKIDYLSKLNVRAIWIQPFETDDVFESTIKYPASPYPDLVSFSKRVRQYDMKVLASFDTSKLASDLEGSLTKIKDHVDGIILNDQNYSTFTSNYKKIKNIVSSDVIIGMQMSTTKQDYKELDLVIRRFECLSPAQCARNIKQNGNHFSQSPYRAYTSSEGTDSMSRNELDSQMIFQGWSLVLNYGEELQNMRVNKTNPRTQPLMNWEDESPNRGFTTASNVSKGFDPDFFSYGVKIQTASESNIDGLYKTRSLLRMYNTKSIKWGETEVYYDDESVYYTLGRGGFQSYFVILPFNTEPISKDFTTKSGVTHGFDMETNKIVNFNNFFIDKDEDIMIFTY